MWRTGTFGKSLANANAEVLGRNPGTARVVIVGRQRGSARVAPFRGPDRTGGTRSAAIGRAGYVGVRARSGERGEGVRDGVLGGDRGPRLLDRALLVDQERGADQPDRGLAVAVLLAPRAPGLGRRVIGVREQREAEAVLLVEGKLLGRQVGRDADDVGADPGEARPVVAEVARLPGAPGRVGLRIEVHEELPAPVVVEPDRRAVLVEQLEPRRRVAWLQGRHASTVPRHPATSPFLVRRCSEALGRRPRDPSVACSVSQGVSRRGTGELIATARTRSIWPATLVSIVLLSAVPAAALGGGALGASGDAGLDVAEASLLAQPPGSVAGIDVSHWQGSIDWAQVAAAGKEFAFAKATDGQTYVDPFYATNKAAAELNGIAFGTY